MSQINVGDVLVSINEFETSGLPHSQIVRMVRGAPGTQVALGLRHPPGPSGNPGKLYVVNLIRGRARPVSQRAFGSPEHGGSPGAVASTRRTSRSFVVL